ncbi:MAG: hypothetical protein ACRC2K_09010, partial [Clostridium sp.]
MKSMQTILTDSLEVTGIKTKVPFETCKACMEPLEKDVELFGRVTRVRKICSCKLKEREEKEKREQEKERQIYLNKIFKNSFLEEKFKNATFQ